MAGRGQGAGDGVGRRAALAERAVGEPGQGLNPIVHHDCASHGNIDAKRGRDFYAVVAFGQQFGRKRAAFGAEHVSGAQRVAETWQVDGVIDQFDADELAAVGQRHLVEACPVIVWQMQLALGRVGVGFESLVGCADGEREMRAKAMGRPH